MEKEMGLTANEENYAKELFKMETQPDLRLTQYQAYLNAYPNRVDSKREQVEVDASVKANSPKIVLRLEELRKPVIDKLIYSALDSFNKLNEIQELAKNNPVVVSGVVLKDAVKAEIPSMLKAEELKGKLTGLYVDKKEITNDGKVTIVTREGYDD